MVWILNGALNQEKYECFNIQSGIKNFWNPDFRCHSIQEPLRLLLGGRTIPVKFEFRFDLHSGDLNNEHSNNGTIKITDLIIAGSPLPDYSQLFKP